MKAICTACPHTNPLTARSHADTTGHNVSVWDTGTSQLPRALWPTEKESVTK